MASDLRVYALTFTDSDVASEHVYAGNLGSALSERGIEFVEDWRRAHVVHLFEVNVFTRAAFESFRFPTLLRILRSDVPVVVSTDDLYFIDRPDLTFRPRLYRANHYVQRWLLRAVDGVIAISESVRRALSSYLPKEKIHVVYHGVDDRYFGSTESTDEFLLHVSQAAPRKNPEAIVEVARRLAVRFVVVGEGWSEYVPPDVTTVDLRGFVSEETLIDLYKSASVFYFPTLHEGFGLPILEAMAAGCAVVTSNAYAVPEVTGDAAITLDPLDVQAHIDAIRSLFGDESRRRHLARAGTQRARQFSWSEAAERTEAVYRSVVSSAGQQ